ncbi:MULTISPECIES: hypothetical protein [unclassified Streptomyces]|uniref:hypothetical protein n=1 Tax=unclassified Streptomyces TaxID=2593676 RepID=UPI002E0F23AC|nr:MULTISPECIES: hypothetical protein [unclassified Streptomyces]WSR22783.1 hypothetical protein OG573_29055 [Streptomyces sp. NBC_01205]
MERLKALGVAEGEELGPYEVREPLLDEPMSELYEARPAVCGPLTNVGTAGHTARAYARVSVPGELQAVGTEIVLRTYRDAGAAAAAVESLADAGRPARGRLCRGACTRRGGGPRGGAGPGSGTGLRGARTGSGRRT